MNLLANLAVGLFYLPFLATPFVILFWYAFAPNGRNEPDQIKKEAEVDRAGPEAG